MVQYYITMKKTDHGKKGREYECKRNLAHKLYIKVRQKQKAKTAF
jgi:hypothetical protein